MKPDIGVRGPGAVHLRVLTSAGLDLNKWVEGMGTFKVQSPVALETLGENSESLEQPLDWGQ